MERGTHLLELPHCTRNPLALTTPASDLCGFAGLSFRKSIHELDRILKVHKLLILQIDEVGKGIKIRYLVQNRYKTFAESSRFDCCPSTRQSIFRGWAGSNILLLHCSHLLIRPPRTWTIPRCTDRCRATQAGVPVRVGPAGPITLDNGRTLLYCSCMNNATASALVQAAHRVESRLEEA